MPVNNGNHWVLVVLDLQSRMMRVYNSKCRRGESLRDIGKFLQGLTSLLPKILDKYGVYDGIGGGDMGEKQFQIEGVENCPQQNDSGNCGMFLLKFAEFLMMGRDINEIKPEDMPMYRKKMAMELMMYNERRTKDSVK
ncbi:unnamed protein product [Cuscuta epithymum]|uniref:Ubiquitin-like protease family profile domain-containing protein n=1 Tax=Cuscuta epithymum TaxID=186058 RepID=A0AAV0F0R7_9ASTE|nr:unnamed protein product [Cuscuta epithymum]